MSGECHNYNPQPDNVIKRKKDTKLRKQNNQTSAPEAFYRPALSSPSEVMIIANMTKKLENNKHDKAQSCFGFCV